MSCLSSLSNLQLRFYKKTFGLGLRNRCFQSDFVDGAHRRRGHPQRYISTIFRIEESLLLQVGMKSSFGTTLRVRNVVSYHYFLTSELTYAAHSVAFSDGKETKENPAIQPFAGTSSHLFCGSNDPCQRFSDTPFNVARPVVANVQAFGLHSFGTCQRHPYRSHRFFNGST